MSQNKISEGVIAIGVKNEKFGIKPSFLRLLESVGANGKAFSITQVLTFMKHYIIAHNLYDKKNPRRIVCPNDDLGRIFGVTEFTIDELMKLLALVLYRLPPSIESSDPSNTSSLDSIKRPSAAENVDCKKQKLEDVRPASPIIICIPDKPDYDSTCETDMSIQSRETALAKDSTDDPWFSDEDDCDVEGDDDCEDYFSVEYEVGSQSSVDGGMMSDTDSDVEEVINAVLICKDDNDMEFWADYSSEDNEDSTDPELDEGDKWICSRCKSLNRPPMRYCQKCWDERIGWLPENRRHPPPKRRRRKRRASKLSKSGGKKGERGTKTKGTADVQEDKSQIKKEKILDSLDGASTSYGFDKSEKQSEIPVDLEKFCNDSFAELPLEDDSASRIPFSVSDRESNTCPLCMQREKTAIIVHGRTGHQLCCYPCARHLENQNKPCPICRRTIQKVIRNFYV